MLCVCVPDLNAKLQEGEREAVARRWQGSRCCSPKSTRVVQSVRGGWVGGREDGTQR